MKKLQKLSLLIFVFQLVNLHSYSQNEDSLKINNPILMNEIIVTAEKTPISFSKTAKVIRVISKEELNSNANISLDQTLRNISSIDVRQRGTYGVQSDISIRGGHYEQSMVMLNGVNFNDPQTGHFNLNLPIDFGSISRIEIIQGSASRTLGANAMSGVINMIVTPEDTNYIKVSAMVGQYGLNSQGLSANLASKKTKHLISFSRGSSKGYIDNTDFDYLNAYYFMNYNSKAGNYEFQFGYNTREFGANSFYTARFPNQFEANETALSSLKFESNTKIKLIPLIYWRHNTDRFELFRNNEDAPSWYAQHNYHKSQVVGASISAVYESKIGTSSLGLNFRNEEIYSTVLGNPLETVKPVKGYENINFSKYYKRNYSSLHFNHNYTYKKLYLSGGLMADINSDISKVAILPGADASYELTKKTRVFASANKSMRMPTFTDLFYKSATLIGNTELTYEQSTTYEAGFKYFGNSIFAQLSAFERQGKNLIDWIKYPNDSLWRSENLTEITYKGIEFQSVIYPEKINSNLKFIKRINFGYTYLYVSNKSEEFQSAYAFDQLKHKSNLTASFQVLKNTQLSYSISYNNRYGSYEKFENTIKGELTPYEDFFLSDVRLLYTAKKWSAFADVSNIFDKKYYDIGNIIQSGRWIRIGASFKIIDNW